MTSEDRKIAASCALLVTFTFSFAECKKANPEDVPHGANELIELRTQKVTHVSGTIFFSNEEPASEIVVEVYRHPGNLDPSLAVKPPRLAACITGEDGKFSFPEIKGGKYVLHVGIRKPAGVDEMLVPIVVKRFGWLGKRSTLKLRLQLGT